MENLSGSRNVKRKVH